MSSIRKYSRSHNKSLSKKLRTRSYRRPQKIAPFHILKGGSSNNNSDDIEQISDEERDALWTSIEENYTDEVNIKEIIQYFIAKNSNETIQLIMKRLGILGYSLCNQVEDFDSEPCSVLIDIAKQAGYESDDSQHSVDVWNEFIRLINEYQSDSINSSSSSGSTEISDEDRDFLWKQLDDLQEGTVNLRKLKNFLLYEQEADETVQSIMKKLEIYEKCESLDDFDEEPCSKLNEIAKKAGYASDDSQHSVDVWNEFIRLINELESSESSNSNSGNSGNSGNSNNSSSNSGNSGNSNNSSSSSSSNSSSQPPTTQEKYASMRNDYVYLLEELTKFRDGKTATTNLNDMVSKGILKDTEKLLIKITMQLPDEDTTGISDSDLEDLIKGGQKAMEEIEAFFTYYNVKYDKPSDVGDEDFKHVNQLLKTCEELKRNYEIKHEEVKLLGEVITALKTEFDELMKKKLNDKDLKSNIGLIQAELTILKEKLQDPGLSKKVEGIQEMLKELPNEQAQVLSEVQKKVDNLIVSGMTNSTKKLHNSKTMGDLRARLKTAIAKHPGSSSTVSGMAAPKSESKRTHKKKPRRKKGSRKSKGVKVSGVGNAEKGGTYIKISRKKRSHKKK